MEMADEYGNLEVGIEIVDTDVEELPKVMFKTVYYLNELEATAGSVDEAVVMELMEAEAIPDGYTIVGMRRIRPTNKAYDESAILPNDKAKGSDAAVLDIEQFQVEGNLRQRTYPAALNGRVKLYMDRDRTVFTQAEVIFVLAPGEIVLPETE